MVPEIVSLLSWTVNLKKESECDGVYLQATKIAL